VSRRSILCYPDTRLRQQAAEVTCFDGSIVALVDDLIETMYASGGIGLSAPQVGDARQVLVMDLSADKSSPTVFINPMVRFTGQRCMVEESCLSVPGVEAKVIRVNRLDVRAKGIDGEAFERELIDMHAVCLQHEMDHLAGKLFIDRLPLWRRAGLWLSRRAYRPDTGPAINAGGVGPRPQA
jgi:peptide deformylase